MGAVIEVKYFNSFLLKKITESTSPYSNLYNGSFGIPNAIGGWARYNSGNINTDVSWAIEESRIRGGFNNTTVDFGVRAYTTTEEPEGFIRGNTLIYSGIFNSRTGINQTNVFSVGEDITKSLDPVNGTVQKLYAEDTNLIIFQENKISRALIDKDALYSAEGGSTAVNALTTVIGQIVPYAGEFGISRNPESFAVYGYRKYFTDRDRNVVLRLSRDGLTPISNYGMYDYFRDTFNTIDSGELPGRLTGGWDMYSKQYTLCLQGPQTLLDSNFATLSFDEKVLGWTSFYSYNPDQILSLRNNTYTIKDDKLFKHYSQTVPRNNFYGKNNITSVTFVFNPSPNYSKTFKTINYEGSSGWKILGFFSDKTGAIEESGLDIFVNDSTTQVLSLNEGEYVINPANGEAVLPSSYQSVFGVNQPGLPRLHAGFSRKENKYVANLINNTSLSSAEVRGGRDVTGIKGFFATVNIATDGVTDFGGAKQLFSVGSKYNMNSGYE
tara:strand:+ start:96 stop:1583 length:1488 start_codon:yes stop_codon:yes gene_type:complete